MAGIVLERVTKTFPNGFAAVRDLSLTIEDGEFIVLVGASGCGKTTLLRLIAGLEEATAGTISIDGKDVTERPPRQRDVAMVFQSYALYPHMNVRQNLGYGLKVRRIPKQDAKRRVEETAELLGLTDLLDRRPAQLSGGQRQRVAMGRAIVREPKAFLMDEPLSNLDAKLRVGMRASLSELHARLGVTTVYVTHDQVEAMTLGQRVAVMRDGRILQVDRPQRLYEAPQDLFVAAFIGSPAMNLVEARIEGNEVSFGQFRVPMASDRRPSGQPKEVVLGIRPESFEDAAFAPSGLPTIEVSVAVLEELGADSHTLFRVDAPRITAEMLEAQDEATLLAEPTALFSARVDPKTQARVGESLDLAVDPSAFHFFDRDSGEGAGSGRRGANGLDHHRRARMTKQSETRERVLDLIEQLGVGEAIPSERQLSGDLGVSRLTVRAALDDLVREGFLERRHGAGTFVSEPKIAQELTMTSFTEDMQRRGMVPSSKTLELKTVAAGARLGRLLHVSPSEQIVVVTRLRYADRETMAIETLHVCEALVPGLTAKDLEQHSFYELLEERFGVVVVGRQPGDRADGDERRGVRRAWRPAPLACVSVRAHDQLGRWDDCRVRPLDLPRRSLPARQRSHPPAGSAASGERGCRRSLTSP